MASCARCDVARLMARENKGDEVNVIEIKRPPLIDFGDGEFEIYLRISDPLRHRLEANSRAIFYRGSYWRWAMTLFSSTHSLDEDCYARRDKQFFMENGYPPVVDAESTIWVVGR